MKIKTLFLFVGLLCSVSHLSAQRNPNFSWGVYTSLNVNGVQPLTADGLPSNDGDFSIDPQIGFSLGATIQHQTMSWLGFRSGLIFQQRRYGYVYPDPNGGIYETLDGIRNMYMLSVPAIVRFTPGRVFSLNVGTAFNVALGRGKEEDWAWLEEPAYQWGDITLYTSFEFRLYRGLHIGTGISWGLNPWGESLVHTGNNPPKEINTYSHRSLFINLQYVFERE